MIKEYIAYLKDNPKGYWFKRKLYGWGWTPATWQGWAVFCTFLVGIIWNILRIEAAAHSENDGVRHVLIQTFILIALLIAICYAKGEKPRWQWGIPKKDDSSSQPQ